MKNGKRILSVTIKHIYDESPDTSYLEQEGFEDRLAEYRAGDFHFIGIRAEATIQVETHGTIQTITSGGLWCIDSDSGDNYFRVIEAEELSTLKGTLSAMGFSRRAIAAAFKDVVRHTI